MFNLSRKLVTSRNYCNLNNLGPSNVDQKRKPQRVSDGSLHHRILFFFCIVSPIPESTRKPQAPDSSASYTMAVCSRASGRSNLPCDFSGCGSVSQERSSPKSRTPNSRSWGPKKIARGTRRSGENIVKPLENSKNPMV